MLPAGNRILCSECTLAGEAMGTCGMGFDAAKVLVPRNQIIHTCGSTHDYGLKRRGGQYVIEAMTVKFSKER